MKSLKFLLPFVLLSVVVACTDGGPETPEPPETPKGPTGLTDEVVYEPVGDVESIGLIEHYELLIEQATENIKKEHLIEFWKQN